MRPWAAAVVLACASGCAPIVEAEFSDIEVTRPNVSIPGAPASTPTITAFSFAMDSGAIGASSDPGQQSRIRSVRLKRLGLSASGVANLSFIRNLHAVAFVPVKKSSSVTTPSRQVEVADYERRGTDEVGSTLDVPLPEPVDIAPLLQPTSSEQRRIVVQVNLGGQLPTNTWSVDVSMWLSVELRQ